MIKLHLNEIEYFDDELNEFYNYPAKTVEFEYSLLAVAKWEAKWKVPHLSTKLESKDERLTDLYLCMSSDPTLTKEYIDDQVARTLSEYINEEHTATVIHSQNDNKSKGQTKGKVYTAEEIYAIMFMNQIPIEFEKRNLNSLLLILRIISIYNKPPEKMSQRDTLRQNAALNAARKKQHNTKG